MAQFIAPKVYLIMYTLICGGPSRKPSLGGARYMLAIIDDYSRKVWPYFNGGEFCSDAFDDYCRKEGIVRHHTIP